MNGPRLFELWSSLSLQACLLVWLTNRLANRQASDQARDRLWSTCMAALLVLAAGDFILPHLRFGHLTLSAARLDGAAFVATTSAICTALLVLWLCGAVVSLAVLVLGLVRGYLLVRGAEPIRRVPPQVIDSLRSMPELCPAIDLLTHPGIAGPFCWQFHRPVIVIPRFLLEFPAQELAAIIRHEVAHLRSGHPLRLFLQRMAAVVFWYHPVVQWSMRQASRYREFVCDDAAVATRTEAAAFLRGMLRLVEVRTAAVPTLSAGLTLTGRANFVAERATRLGTIPRPIPPDRRERVSAWAPLIAAPLLTLALWIPVDAGASPRALWSPWPPWTAVWLHAVGLPVRDYEIDNHRLAPHDSVHPAAGAPAERQDFTERQDNTRDDQPRGES